MNILDLPEFTVLRQEASEHDYMFFVEKTEEPDCCPYCGVVGELYKHGSQERIVRDINRNMKRVGLTINQRRYRCRACGKTFSDSYDSIAPNSKMTARLLFAVAHAALKRPFEQVATEFGISATTVERAFSDYIRHMDNCRNRDAATPRVLGIDEAHLNKKMRTVFCDVERGLLLDILEDRSFDTTTSFLYELHEPTVEVVTVDMYYQYHNAVKEVLPSADIVVDKFHVVKKAVESVNAVRKQLRSNGDRLPRNSLYLVRSNNEDLSNQSKIELEEMLQRFPQLKLAYELKEGVRSIYGAEDKQTALEMFHAWSKQVPPNGVFAKLKGTITRWKTPIFNYFDHPYTNAFVENQNGMIKLVQRIGRGYSFETLRAKMLYGTSATQPPKFGEEERLECDDADFMYEYLPYDPATSFGVSVSTLKQILEQGDF